MTRIVFAPVLGLAVLAMSSCAHAQPGGWSGSARRSGGAIERYQNADRAAYDNGYREGARTGARDGRRGSRFAYQNERVYQRADRGYDRRFGNVARYRQVFRSGFVEGYSEAYQGYGRDVRRPGRQDPRWSNGYPNGSRFPGRGSAAYDPAFRNGASDGYEKGVEDARRRRSFDVLRHTWYREGDRHFEGRYGSRERYKDAYRLGFKDGYARGYRGGR